MVQGCQETMSVQVLSAKLPMTIWIRTLVSIACMTDLALSLIAVDCFIWSTSI